MLDITLRGLDKIGYQVVTPLQLHLNLCKGVLVAILQRNQFIEYRDYIKNDQYGNNQNND